MPSIPISDGLNITADAQLAPWSSLAKYAQDFPRLVASGADLSQSPLLTLSGVPVNELETGLAFERPIPLSAGAPEVTLGAAGAVHFAVLKDAMFSPDLYGDNIAIPADQCAVRFGFSAGPTAGASVPVGSAAFGLEAEAGI